MLQAVLDTLVSNPLSTLTGVLVVITLYYAIITHLQLAVSRQSVEVMRKQNEMSTRPYIIVRPIRDGMIFHLQVTNTGKTAAENLKLDIDSSFYCADEEGNNLKEQHLFSEGVESFAPGTEVNYMLGTMPQIFGDEQSEHPMPTEFCVTARYSYLGGDATEMTHVDLDQFAEQATLQMGAAREVRKSRKALEKIAKST